MTYVVKFSNFAGVLERREVADDEAAGKAAIEMIETAGRLYPGDRIVIEERDDDEPPVEVPCIDGRDSHEWVVSDENENVCYCSRCGVPEF
jgi:hypothetical protein